ncbi:MAG: lipase maturation factor family protein [Deltaproteobacteria bacterium]|nr:lipase maturation factor family protein [Deltaproteobacteria bacterium]
MASERGTRTFVISSWVFARALGATLFIAFVSLGVQAQGLFGQRGVTPIADFVDSAHRAGHSFFDHPSLLWFGTSDAMITAVWVLGAIASAALLVGWVPRIAAFVCWLAYLSFVTVGWPFMSFQWDTLLLEICFTSVFLVPMRLWDRLHTHIEPNKVARWALWFLLFRLLFRSAWVKLASHDPTWGDLSALTYHYWTQPLPTTLAWYANLLPAWFHKLSCALMFIIEFGAPILLWVPRVAVRRAGAVLILILMALIALTGNYGFFNLLTVLLCLTVFDDELFARFVSKRARERLAAQDEPTWRGRAAVAPAIVIALTAIIFYTGTFGERRMPGWLRPLYPFSTFNNYGLFAVMTTKRLEIIIEGSRDGENWEPYVFRYKPGPLNKAPAWVAPHQPRLDWQMWFAALGDFRRNVWLASLMRGLLANEPSVVELIEGNPFEDSPPTQIRAVIYEYEFTSLEERRESGHWWKRGEPMLYAPVLGVQPVSTAQ